jgi:hypothetical protein
MREGLLMLLLLLGACAGARPQRDSATSSRADSGAQPDMPGVDASTGGSGGEDADPPPVSSGGPRDAAPAGADGGEADAAEPADAAASDAAADSGADAGSAISARLCPLVDTCGSHQGTSCPAQPPRGECTTSKTCFYCQAAATRPSIEASCSSGTWSWSVPQPCAN